MDGMVEHTFAKLTDVPVSQSPAARGVFRAPLSTGGLGFLNLQQERCFHYLAMALSRRCDDAVSPVRGDWTAAER
eukprot:6059977-Amphidinium_carterae.1